jgi:isopentenyl-diphosphate delta-isomerase
MEKVILVDELDHEIGVMEKLEAHQKGVLHRAFSIFLFNSKGQLLLQKRAKNKYHSAGLWTNACCSHPLPNESVTDAAYRKLKQEMGIELQTSYVYKFIYKITLENNLVEHEYDYVLKGIYDGEPSINKEEAEDWKYVDLKELQNDIQKNPEAYTHWFKLILNHNEFTRLIH